MKKSMNTAASDAARRALEEYSAEIFEFIETLERAERAERAAKTADLADGVK
jgi:hypothetical protein